MKPGVIEQGRLSAEPLRKMALLDTTAIPLDLLSSTERKAVLVLKQHALVAVDEKDLVAMHSLTQLAVRSQADKGDRRGIAAAVARALMERLAKFDNKKPATFFIGRRYAAHARAAAANTAATPEPAPSRDSRLWRRRARHIGEWVGPQVVEARRGAGGVCWATCRKCAGRRGLALRRWADSISRRWTCLNLLCFVPWLSKATTP
jgi:hypothetical protein